MMRARRVFSPAFAPAMVLLAAVALPCPAQSAPAPLFKSETHLVNFTFSVRRPDGTLVKGLPRDSFQVSEDGIPQTIAFFGKEEDLPLTLGLIVDVSDSQSRFIKRHRADIERFLHAIVRPNDQVFTICFGDHLRLTNDLTSDTKTVLDGLEAFDKGNRHFPELAAGDKREGGTALYDAIYTGIGEKLSQAEDRRKALILFTDGEENSSAHDLLDAIDAARESDTLIYAIRYTDEKDQDMPHGRQGVAALHHLGVETGGADFDALHANLGEVFEKIADELRSLYSIGYHSTHHERDGSFHRVQIVTTDGSLVVRARTGYYAR